MSNNPLNAFGGGNNSGGGFKIPDFSQSAVKTFYAKPGRYPAKCTVAKQGSTQSGRPAIIFSFEVETPEGVVSDRRVTCVIDKPDAMWSLRNVCESLDINTGDDLSTATGKRCVVELVDDGEGSNGAKFCKINKCIRPAGGTAASPLPPGPEDDNVPF